MKLTSKECTDFKYKIKLFGEALEAEGITYRKNFSCCNGCGHAEMDIELDGKTSSYVFYHQQKGDILKGSGILHLQHYIEESDVATVLNIVKAYGGYWNGTHCRTIQLPFVRFTAEQLKEMKEI